MVGVMGLSHRGIDLATPDNKKVHMMVLLATPPDQRDKHLQVLATLVQVVGREPAMRDALFAAKSPAHAYEILHGEEAETYNYFIDD